MEVSVLEDDNVGVQLCARTNDLGHIFKGPEVRMNLSSSSMMVYKLLCEMMMDSLRLK